MNDCPDPVIIAIADYLPKTTRALFAVAMTAPSESFQKFQWKRGPNEISQLIISSFEPIASLYATLPEYSNAELSPNCIEQVEDQIQEYNCKGWEYLDFIDLDSELAGRLSDADVAAVLTCIDAKRKLKTLKLTHCFQVKGYPGLSPLNESLVLEKIDLSLLWQFKSPYRYTRKSLFIGYVLPILIAIINKRGNSLKLIQFPRLWRNTQQREMEHFIELCDGIFRYCREQCSYCHRIQAWSPTLTNGEEESFVCYQCMDICCYSCVENAYVPCALCDKRYCSVCVTAYGCDRCDKTYCDECLKYDSVDDVRKLFGECEDCSQEYCKECEEIFHCASCDRSRCYDCANYWRCDGPGCEKGACADCFVEGDSSNNVERCDDCRQSFCLDCMSRRLEKHDCVRCPSYGRLFPNILKENKRLQAQVESLKSEVAMLKKQKSS